jgi:hypothetical protein
MAYVQAGYQWTRHTRTAPAHKKQLNTLELSIGVNNIGILWRANADAIDPNVPAGGLPQPKTIIFSLKATF